MTTPPENEPHFIVGLGASAGGLEALKLFFSQMSTTSGCSFVVIQHLSPDYKSMMAELLGRCTPMKAQQAEDNMPLRPNEVYLIPPQFNLTVEGKKIKLTPLEKPKPFTLAVDIFFRSLADAYGEQAIAIILSGTGSDGTLGIRAIKEKGGLVFAQSGDSAKFDGMPQNAIHTGLVDIVASPEELAEKLTAYIRSRPSGSSSGKHHLEEDFEAHFLLKICEQVEKRNGIDFGVYKPSTISRRIRRRMGINQITTPEDYLKYLESSSVEANMLAKDFLISVTRFFRDLKSFEKLKTYLPGIFENAENKRVRIWSAGCATGEEVYSLAMMAESIRESQFPDHQLKLFGTDADQEALDFASTALYPKNIAADIPTEYLEKYLTIENEAYFRINRKIRDRVVFAQHDILKNPPFTRMDLVVCRNLVIYLKPEAQKVVGERFQFSLRAGGIFFQGSSESLPSTTRGFKTLSVSDRIYQRDGSNPPRLNNTILNVQPVSPKPKKEQSEIGSITQQRFADREHIILQKLIEQTGAAGLVVNEESELILSAGAVNRYLQLKPGPAQLDIIKMAGEQLGLALHAVVGQAFRTGKPVHFSNIRLRANSEQDERTVDLDVVTLPVDFLGAQSVLVVIRPSASNQPAGDTNYLDLSAAMRGRLRDLEHELSETRESLAAANEEQEASNEELQASNEELLASNEELQSTNEELESVNEELHTVNIEYQFKISEMAELSEDIDNLLHGSSIGVCFLDEDAAIRFMSPVFRKITGLQESDIGRTLAHFSNPFVCEINKLVTSVMDVHRSRRDIIKNNMEALFLTSVQPYVKNRGESNDIMISCVDVTELEANRAALNLTSKEKAGVEKDKAALLNAIPAQAAMLDRNGIILQLNDAWRTPGLRNGFDSSAKTSGTSYVQTCRDSAEQGNDIATQVLSGLERVLSGVETAYDVDYAAPAENGESWFKCQISSLKDDGGEIDGALVMHTEITTRKQQKLAP